MPDIPFDGFIDKARVDWAISQLKPGDRLVFGITPGGNMREASRLAEHIRKNNIDTKANPTSLLQSAAVLAFAAGKKRTAGDGATFMLHRVINAETGKEDPQSTELYIQELIKYGVSHTVRAAFQQPEGFGFDHRAAKGLGITNADPERMARILGPLE